MRLKYDCTTDIQQWEVQERVAQGGCEFGQV